MVHLDRLWPNRCQGHTSTRIAPHVVDPWHVVSTYEKESTGGEWEVDRENGTATLVKPETKLGRLTLPLYPMLGCFGVAPWGGQALSSVTSAEHGGSMDYKGFEQGVTVYFPVFVEGALLCVGDGHALQGDGEIAGTGIEISFNVQFTVSLQKGKRIGEGVKYSV